MIERRRTPPLSRVSKHYPLAPHLIYPRRLYLLRTLGCAFALLAILPVLHEIHAPTWQWMLVLTVGLVWPHTAWWRYLHTRDPNRTEAKTLMLECALVGACLPMLKFSLAASLTLLAVTNVCAVIGGGLPQLTRGWLAQLAGLVLGVLVFGMHVPPAPDLGLTLAALPMALVLPLGILHTSHDVIQNLRRRRVELERRGWHDGLSGLFNRGRWEETVRAEFARCRRTGQPATLVLVDLDHFKQINDLYGHAEGDSAIRRFADLLRSDLRDIDVPGRYGGEEFGILLPHTSSAEAVDVMRRLQRRLHEAPLSRHRTITASFGVAQLGADIDSADAWIRQADLMLYRAKYDGRDRIAERGNAPAPAPRRTGPLRPVLSPRNPDVLSQLLQGIDVADTPVAMYDPDDKLVMANEAYVRLHAIPPGVEHFEDIIRYTHAQRLGPDLGVDDVELWLRDIQKQRRSTPRRIFPVVTYDGNRFRGIETCFNGGWVLTTMVAPEGAV